MNNVPFKNNDRVKRTTESSCFGTVRTVREELRPSSHNDDGTQEKCFLIKVLWDNGTTSYSSPASLQVVETK